VLKFINRLFKEDDLGGNIKGILQNRMGPAMCFETPVKRYTKSELAMLYKRTVPTLMNWINDNPELIEALSRLGYKKSQKEFRKEHVRLIFTYLGEP